MAQATDKIFYKTTQFKCTHCEEEYWIKWEAEIEPDTCPFCGGESGVEEDEAIFVGNGNVGDEDDNDWN